MNSIIRLLVGLLISGVCLWFTLRNFHFSELISSLKNVSYIWILPTLIVYLFGFVLRTFRWKAILSSFLTIKFSALFPILTLGFLANNFLPARGGEFLRAIVGAKMTDKPTSSFLGSIALERLTDIMGLLVVFILSTQAFQNESVSVGKLMVLITVGFAGCFAMVFIGQRISKISVPKEKVWLSKFLEIVKNFSKGFESVKSIRVIAIAIPLAIMVWFGEVLTVYLLSKAFHLNLNYFQACALMVGISLGVSIPAAPGYVGTYELFAKKTLVLMGFASGPALSFVLGLHFFHLLISSAVGLPLVFQKGLSILSTGKKAT